jgi:predicted RNA-binding protein (virulence factor B family)
MLLSAIAWLALWKISRLIAIGEHHELTILRPTTVGLFLGDGSGEEDILLPNKYCPQNFDVGDKIRVFVYRDHEERKIATTLQPKILLNQFAFLRVTSVSNVGAFMDWGLEKELMVPFREQRQKMQEGRWYIVYLDVDRKTDRLFATNKIEKRLKNENLTVKEGDAVDLMVMQKTDLGFSVIVNQKHEGLIFESDIFSKLNIGDKIKGYVKQIRADNKIDISLQPIGFRNFNDPNCEMILDKLKSKKGFLPITDKSTPDEVYATFGISKKAYKKAIGTLYKQRKISLQEDGIRLV